MQPAGEALLLLTDACIPQALGVLGAVYGDRVGRDIIAMQFIGQQVPFERHDMIGLGQMKVDTFGKPILPAFIDLITS